MRAVRRTRSALHTHRHAHTDACESARKPSTVQGLRFLMADGSRIIFRLSGTGSAGATIRMYLEKYVEPAGGLYERTGDVMGELVAMALAISQLERFTGRQSPTVIT